MRHSACLPPLAAHSIEAISYMLSKQLAARLAAQLAASGSGRRGAGSGDSQRSAKL